MSALFDGFFDDAALFPPGDAPMAVAVPAHRDLVVRFGALVGPFVVPASRLAELAGCLDDGDALPVSVIAPAPELAAAVDRVVAEPRLALVAVEVPGVLDDAAAAEAVGVLGAALPGGVTAAVELPRTAARDAVLDVLAGTGARAKLRTGGLRAELFPSAAELASTLHACLDRQVAVKCTAGLHAAVRHTDPATGFEHHGFLNVLVAVDALLAGEPAPAAASWLRRDDGLALAAAVLGWPADRVARARAAFTSFGTCSVLEPVTDLVALGLLTAPVPA